MGPEHCAYVRAKVFTDKALTSRANLDAQRQAWIKEAGFTPAGNAEDQAFWEVRSACWSLVLSDSHPLCGQRPPSDSTVHRLRTALV